MRASYGSAWYFLQRQIVWTLLGAVGFLIALRVDYRAWRRAATPLLIAPPALDRAVAERSTANITRLIDALGERLLDLFVGQRLDFGEKLRHL